ncbi:MAG: tetratricopeptide repeat protein, partial [Candidatus Methanofastidiosia archaeon]
LGNLYSDLREFKKAEESYTEALGIRRKLAQKDPGAYESDVDMTLNNLGALYSDLREFKKAEESYTEALDIYRKLAQKDPGAYESYVATTLNNLGALYSDLREFKKAEESYTEALKHKETLPDDGARILLGLAQLWEKTHNAKAYELYFQAAVLSFNVYAKYRLPSIDYLHCLEKTKELAPEDTPTYRMASIALLGIGKLNNTVPPHITESIDSEDLPSICRAIMTLLTTGEITRVEAPRNDVEFMFSYIYESLALQIEQDKKKSHP